MMKFNAITLFPELLETYCRTSIIGRGIQSGKLSLHTYNPRDFCTDKYRKVDDTPYGGGAGMVLKPEPFFAAFAAIPRDAQTPAILLTPQGQPFKQATARELSQHKEITLICGHYEGFDERIATLATHEISIGDFILTGGELAALTVIDAVGRLITGVLGTSISLAEESFDSGLLEAPQYTKPASFRGIEVPEILRSGDHQAVAQWRRAAALTRTYLRRPDLLLSAKLTEVDKKIIAKFKNQNRTIPFSACTNQDDNK